METYINTSSSWFYNKASDVLFLDEDNKKAGILTNTPRYELDVNGTLYATTYCNLPAFAFSNEVYPRANYGSNTANYASNNMVFNQHVVQLSNLAVMSNVKLDTLSWKNNQYVLDQTGKIDAIKWLSNVPTFEQDNTLAIAGLAVGAAGVVSSLGGQLLSQTGAGSKLLDDIQNKLGGDELDADWDETADDSNLLLHWNAVQFKPIFNNRGSTNIGINNRLYMGDRSKICRVANGDLISYDNGRTRRILPQNGDSVVYDFSNDSFYPSFIYNRFDIDTDTIDANLTTSCNLITSNATITSNLFVKNITASNLTASNAFILSNLQATEINANAVISASVSVDGTLRVGTNWYLKNDGLYLGDPINPLLSQIVIDSAGRYKGLIEKEQIMGEAFSMQSLGDGILQWDPFNTTTNSAFIDSFTNIDNPLFDVVG